MRTLSTLLAEFGVAIMVCALPLSSSQGTTPAPPKVITISDIAYSSVSPDDQSFQLSFVLESAVDVKANVDMRFLGGILSAEGDGSVSFTTELRSEAPYNVDLPLIVKEEKPTWIGISVELSDCPLLFYPRAYASLWLEASFDTLTSLPNPVIEPDGGVTRYDDTYQAVRQSRESAAGTGQSPGESESTAVYSFSFDGKVLADTDATSFGVPDVIALASFRKSSDGSKWFPYSGSDPPGILHFNYDRVAEDGSYWMSGTFEAPYPLSYDQLLIRVSSENHAAWTIPPDYEHIVWMGGGDTYFFGESHWRLVSINPNDTEIVVSDHIIPVPDAYGMVLRHGQLSREFYYSIFEGNPSQALYTIRTFIQEIEHAGQFTVGNDYEYIVIDPYYFSYPNVVCHEFGHWAHYLLLDRLNGPWGQSRAFDEGFAIFYSWAARNRTAALYDDHLHMDWSGTDDVENAPFRNPRYDGIGYTWAGHPDYSAAGCYFWAVYDEYEGDGFESPTFDGDNDDCCSNRRQLFDSMYEFRQWDLGGPILELFNENFFYSSLGVEGRAAAEQIDAFMFADLYEVPENVRMQSAQVSELDAIDGEQPGSLRLTWSTREYPDEIGWYPNCNGSLFGNWADGIRVYREPPAGGGFELLATLDRGATSFEYLPPDGDLEGTYRVTSFNELAGESGGAPTYPVVITESGGAAAVDKAKRPAISAYPNPFNPEVNIEYVVTHEGTVSVSVYNVGGELVKTLSAEEQPAGLHRTSWDGKANSGQRVPGGVYFCKVAQKNGERTTAKIILLP